MIKFFAVLDKLLDMLNAWVARREQAKTQGARDEIEQNPADWFSQHFNGLYPTNSKTNSEADKADTDNQ